MNRTARSALPEEERACIIGAGFSGLSAARALGARGIPYDQFEMGEDVGGLWRVDHESGRSAAYENLYAITSAETMALWDHPFPEEVPTFPRHDHILAYAESYADRFDLRSSVDFGTKVTRVVPEEADEGRRWRVTLEQGTSRRYGAVLVATGHHWKPRRPDFAGTFDGELIHARAYRRPEPYRDKEVLVVGVGNTGTGIAVDLCGTAARTVLSSRSGAWVLPKYLLGIPIDQWSSEQMERLPVAVRRWTLQLLRWLALGAQERYGFPRPDHRMMEAHPTVNQSLLAEVDHGRIDVRGNVGRFEGREVEFTDGTRESFDVVILATGYEIAFPFLSPEVFTVQDQDVGLYRYVVDPDQPGLYFLGLVQPAGPIPPLSERQARWVADLLAGRGDLPPRPEMKDRIVRERKRRRDRYKASPRHTLEVDFWDYVHQIERERIRARRRV